MQLPRTVVRVANAITILALRAGIPRPPILEATRSSLRRWVADLGSGFGSPLDNLEDDGRIIVVVEDGPHAHWVRNALADDGRLRIYLRESWRGARLRVLDADPDTYLRRMSRMHAAFVRSESSTPGVVEIRPE